MILKNPPSKKHGGIFSVENLDGYLFALSLGYGLHKDADLFDDPALTADDLAHIAVCDAYFEHSLAAGFALGHSNLVGMIHEVLYNIGQQFFHWVIFLLMPQPSSAGP